MPYKHIGAPLTVEQSIANKALSIAQAAMSSGANTHYRFGRFESAIHHLHSNLARYLERLDEFEKSESFVKDLIP